MKMNIRTTPVSESSVWTGDELESNRSWEVTLSEQHVDELLEGLAEVSEQPLELINVEAFRKPALTTLMSFIREQLMSGYGFAMVRGFPIEGHSLEDIERMYWGIGSHIGTGVTQNREARLIHYITDGPLNLKSNSRNIGKPGRVGLHGDLTDCVSLLCVRQAVDNPCSRVASAMHIYNEILNNHPEWLPRLYEGYEWDRHDEQYEHEAPTSGCKIPVYSQKNGIVSCRYNPGYIRRACERLDISLTDEDMKIFRFMNRLAFKSCFEFPFRLGDIQFVNNYTVLHGRAEHEDQQCEDRKRTLMRLWLDFPESRSLMDEALIRYSLVRFGALGWTASDLLKVKRKNRQ